MVTSLGFQFGPGQILPDHWPLPHSPPPTHTDSHPSLRPPQLVMAIVGQIVSVTDTPEICPLGNQNYCHGHTPLFQTLTLRSVWVTRSTQRLEKTKQFTMAATNNNKTGSAPGWTQLERDGECHSPATPFFSCPWPLNTWMSKQMGRSLSHTTCSC